MVERDNLESCAYLLTQNLPRDNIRVMLHGGDDNLIASSEERPAVALCDQINGLGRPADEDDLASLSGGEELSHRLPGALVGLRRHFAQRMDATMHIRVVRRIIPADRIDHDLRFLTRGRIVKVDERFPMDCLLSNREI